ncbi:MAG: hypothetical protein EAZ91_24720 [Cytophagales bacterium]|nr:MAG: hypothetical protein EAZ91_24720 [Cytophagales bacterium]
MNKPYGILFALLLTASPLLAQKSDNPAAPGFDVAGSDARAVQIADEVMRAMGGRKAWDKTHFISWNFFGNRRLIWDKWSGNVRVDNLKNDQTVILNVNTDKGRVFRNGKEETNPDSVAKYVKAGKGAWINDSYWLVMPYKLKDSGVTLKHLGEENTTDNKPADLLQLTFKSVGNTPDNKYKVWVDKSSRLVSQWAYYPKFSDEKPGFTLPWTDYQPHGEIKLSGKRGPRELTDIRVFTGLPGEVFTSFDRPDLNRY